MPFFYKLTFEIITLAQAYFIEWDINLVPAEVKFNNLRAAAKLPWVGHVITSPAALESVQIFKVVYFKISELHFKNFAIDDESQDSQILRQKIANNQINETTSMDSNSESSDDNFINLDYLPHNCNH